MSRVSGKAGEVTIAAGSVVGIKDWTLSYKVSALDSTGFDSLGAKRFDGGITEWSGSFAGFKDGAPLAIDGTVVAIVCKETQTATQKWSGSCILTDISSKTDVANVVTYSYTFQGTAVLTPPSA